MSNNGYFSLPRSLTRTKMWNDLPLSYQKVFIVLVDHACFNICKFDDHGHIFELKPGQFCASYAEIKELCGKHVNLIDVERAIKKFILYDFVRQEVRYRKSIITITHTDTYNLIIRGSEVTSEVNLRQTCGKLEVQKKNKRTKEQKTTTPPTPSNEGAIVVSFEKSQDNEILEILNGLPKLKPDDKEALTPTEKKSLLKYLKKIPIDRIKLAVEFFKSENPKKGYVAGMRWHCDASIPPISELQKEKSKQEIAILNKKFAQKAQREFMSEYYKVEALNQSVLISPKGPNGDTDMLEYGASGFEDRFGLLLRKRNFIRSQIVNEACLIYSY